jgi:hypothetical protein
VENSRQPGNGSTPTYSADSPVLLIAFNRPEETSAVISKLREVRPRAIYYAVDGPRRDRPEDKDLVKMTQSLQSQFDWDCVVSTRFSEVNLGCGVGVSSAISWAFESEERVIILEDDIIPDISFFRYCDELLEFYKDNDDVFAVSGCNFVPRELLPESESYRFSSIPHVWGWAVWKRSWDTYSFDISDWRQDLPIRELHKSLGGSILATFMWSRIFDLIAAKKIDTWDYQLCYAVLKSKSKCATANVNTVTNIGFGNKATHTSHAPTYMLNTEEINYPLCHPTKSLNLEVDRWIQRNVLGASFGRLVKTALKSLKKQ